jgi:hypothetical protein
MNLRGIANRATRVINSNTPVTIYKSIGYTIGVGRKQMPDYAPPVSGMAQIQALDSVELKHLDGLNIQGTIRALYLTGDLKNVIRPEQTGGDLVEIDGQTWLTVKVLEHWEFWVKVAIVLQVS